LNRNNSLELSPFLTIINRIPSWNLRLLLAVQFRKSGKNLGDLHFNP